MIFLGFFHHAREGRLGTGGARLEGAEGIF